MNNLPVIPPQVKRNDSGVSNVWQIPLDDSNSGSEYTVMHRGDSMEPLIGPGDYLKIRLQSGRSYIEYGHPYLIVTAEFSFVARIYEGSTSEKWLLKRENSKQFDAFELDINAVKGLFQVTQILKSLCF